MHSSIDNRSAAQGAQAHAAHWCDACLQPIILDLSPTCSCRCRAGDHLTCRSVQARPKIPFFRLSFPFSFLLRFCVCCVVMASDATSHHSLASGTATHIDTRHTCMHMLGGQAGRRCPRSRRCPPRHRPPPPRGEEVCPSFAIRLTSTDRTCILIGWMWCAIRAEHAS